jgi:DNA (cytosine-5)-methyltransferase 1
MKVLNLYSGLGGNRKLWPDALPDGEPVEITAVEFNPDIAKVYGELYPKDKVIVGDAHEYLLKNFGEFDFIWGSPPCQSHSRINTVLVSKGISRPYPDMKLWQEIILLKSFCRGDFIVENVIPYYKPLIDPSFQLGRHYFWSNKYFLTNNETRVEKELNLLSVKELERKHGINLPKGFRDARQVLRNCVDPEIGLYIFKQFFEREDL